VRPTPPWELRRIWLAGEITDEAPVSAGDVQTISDEGQMTVGRMGDDQDHPASASASASRARSRSRCR
jgi:hypothetical protein